MLLLNVKFLRVRRGIIMLMPNNIKPELSIYYNGYLVLKYLKEIKKIKISDLYIMMFQLYKMSYKVLVFTLDWLYLIDAIDFCDSEEITLCI